MFTGGVVVVALIAIAGPTAAGIPTEYVMDCPVGGEEFTTTGTASSSTVGRMMFSARIPHATL